MLDYTTGDMSEIIKTVFVNDNNTARDIVKIIDFKKIKNGVSEKEIWPSSAINLKLTTSYDFYNKVKQLPNSAYSGPSAGMNVFKEQPLVIHVLPYPVESKWKIEHSDTIADAAVFNEVYSGAKTIQIDFDLVDTETEDPQYCWIRVSPATKESDAPSPTFQFYATNVKKDEGDDGEDQPTSGPLFKWTFENTDNLLRDEVKNASLSIYKNRYSFNNDAIFSTRITEGIHGNALRAIQIVTPELSCIKLDDDSVYKRQKDDDQESEASAKYCWLEIDNGEDQVYTSIDWNFTGGEPVYTKTGETISGKTVQENFVTESNYYACHTGLDLQDPAKDYTISYYFKHHREYSVGFRNFLDIQQSYYTLSPMILQSGQQTNTRNSTYDVRNKNNINDWRHVALTKSREYIATDPANEYNEEKGYGFIIYRGLYIKDVGYPYVRDESKDLNGKFAFTWTDGRIPYNTTTPSIDGKLINTVWLDSTTPANGDNAYDQDCETVISTVKNSESYPTIPYRLEYIDNINLPEKPKKQDMPGLVAAWTGSKASNSRLNAGVFHEASVFNGGKEKVRFGYFYENGDLINIGAVIYSNTAPSLTDGDLFRIKFGYDSSTGENNYDGVDNVCIYDRKLTDSELKQIQDEFFQEKAEVKEKLNVPYNVQHTPKKIKVDNSWYYQNPDLTYYSPTDEDDKFAYFGWRKISGESGLEYLWTEDPDIISKGSKCIIAKGGRLSDDYKIQEIAPIPVDEIPLNPYLVPYIIDSKTIAIVICPHDEVIRTMRILFPGAESLAYNSEHGYIKDYVYGFGVNCLVWRTHAYIQGEICRRADDQENWAFDGNSVVLQSRTYTVPYDFSHYAIQWRNCKPGDKWYTSNAEKEPFDGHAPDMLQIAYLKLDEPMEEGTAHTVTWCGNTCDIVYSHEFACSTIKVNQEGYLPWANTKRAYLGRRMGATSEREFDIFMPAETDRTFYLVPYSHPDIEHAVFSGTMTQRCTAGKASQSGDPTRVASDRYGQGARANRPMNGEHVFQLDFSRCRSAVKDAITMSYNTGVTSPKYFRDEVEDYTYGTITVNDVIYQRYFDKDTCNAYAWINAAAPLSVIYTDTHIPTTDEKARLGYDDYSTLLDISEITTERRLGWTTERTCEEDYKHSDTVWTIEYPSVGSAAMDSDGVEYIISQVLTDQTTEDIAGFYQIYIPNIGWSFKFLIHPQAYFHAYYIAQRGLLHQRSGCPSVKHPYTNWEYKRQAHEIPFEGNFCPTGQASDVNQVWAVDPATHDTILDEAGARICLSPSGTVFAQNTENNKYNTQPMYGIVGGWFDAADFDMREWHIPVVRQLAIAYCICPDNFSDNQTDLPESGNGIPDILNEAMWGAQLWLHSQEPDGGIHGWFETHRHESDWPWESKYKYYCSAESMRHSMTWVSSAATLARALRIAAERAPTAQAKDRMMNLSKIYTDSACAAFSYATKELYDLYMKNPDSERGPSSYFRSQDKTWAWIEWCSVFNTNNDPSSGFKTPYGTDLFKGACALYALTKEERYKKYINADTVAAHVKWFGDYIATNTTDEVAWELITCLKDEFPEYVEQIKAKYVDYSNYWINTHQEKHAYRWMAFAPGFKYVMNQEWGLAHPDCRCGMLLATWILTKNEKYRDAVIAAFDQVYGCNSLGRSWVVGSGYVYPAMHLDSWLPKYKLNYDYWASRPGISPYYVGANALPDYSIRKIAVALEFDGRGDQDCPPIKCSDAIPVNIKRIADPGNYYFDHTPYQAAGQLHGSQVLHVACFEYTIWETISRKAMLLGMLMGPNNKPKYWYKQIAPAKGLNTESNLRNYAFLP